MKTSTVMRKQLEAELKRVETRLAQLETELPRSAGSALQDFPPDDLHDFAVSSENKEAVYENRSRLVSRLRALREALRRLREGTYGRCGECRDPILVKRLRAMPEATLCLACQERRERASARDRATRTLPGPPQAMD